MRRKPDEEERISKGRYESPVNLEKTGDRKSANFQVTDVLFSPQKMEDIFIRQLDVVEDAKSAPLFKQAALAHYTLRHIFENKRKRRPCGGSLRRFGVSKRAHSKGYHLPRKDVLDEQRRACRDQYYACAERTDARSRPLRMKRHLQIPTRYRSRSITTHGMWGLISSHPQVWKTKLQGKEEMKEDAKKDEAREHEKLMRAAADLDNDTLNLLKQYRINTRNTVVFCKILRLQYRSPRHRFLYLQALNEMRASGPRQTGPRLWTLPK